jgi:hypothetical protein
MGGRTGPLPDQLASAMGVDQGHSVGHLYQDHSDLVYRVRVRVARVGLRLAGADRMTKLLIDLGEKAWFRWLLISMMMVNLATVGVAIWGWLDAREDRIADRVRADIIAAEVAEWLAEPLFADDIVIDVTLGDSPHTTTVLEHATSGGPRVLLTRATDGRWYTQLWRNGRMICRSPVNASNPASYGPGSAFELEHSWASYANDEAGVCFGKLEPCGTYELRALRELTRVVGGVPYTRHAPPQRGTVEVPCDWRPR